MYKVSPCIVQLGQYSLVKKNHRFFSKSFVRTTKYPGHHFYNYVIKSILSKVKLRADQDGA